MKSEYKREDLGVGIRGKYYKAYKESHNIVLMIFGWLSLVVMHIGKFYEYNRKRLKSNG